MYSGKHSLSVLVYIVRTGNIVKNVTAWDFRVHVICISLFGYVASRTSNARFQLFLELYDCSYYWRKQPEINLGVYNDGEYIQNKEFTLQIYI